MNKMFQELFKGLPWWFKALWAFSVMAMITIFSLIIATLVKALQHL